MMIICVTQTPYMSRTNVTINFFVGLLVISILSSPSSVHYVHLYEPLPKSSRSVRLAYVLRVAEGPDASRIIGVVHGLVVLADGSGGNA
jgi:hypothetical protein